MFKRPHSSLARVACDTGVTVRALKWNVASVNANGMHRVMAMNTDASVSMSATDPAHHPHFAIPRS